MADWNEYMNDKEYKRIWGTAKDNTVEQIKSLFKSLAKIPKEYPWAQEAYEYMESIGIIDK